MERHQLTERLFAVVQELLTTSGIVLKAGTIVDATMIHAPSSTKNATQTRDPEMKQARKGNTWYFGMKIHVGTDRQGLVHSLTTTDAAQMDVGQLPYLLHGEERRSMAIGPTGRRRTAALRGEWDSLSGESPRDSRTIPSTERWRQINRARSRVRARGEHAFHVVKTLWGFTKVRYRGLAKNTVRAFAAFALANLYLVRYRLGAREATCLR